MVLDPRNRSPRTDVLHFLILMDILIVIAPDRTMTRQDLDPAYNLTRLASGLAEVMDQPLGRLLLWIPGSPIHVLGARIIFCRSRRDDEARQARLQILEIDPVLHA